MSKAVCEICGSREDLEQMANCAQCNAYQHRYCMAFLAYETPGAWLCCECQKKVNRDPRPIQGKRSECQRPLHGCDLTVERKIPMLVKNHKSGGHQSGLITQQRSENSKVKFITSEEAERRPGRTNFAVRRTHSEVRLASPPNVKKSSSKNCIYSSRQARPASPPNGKQSSSVTWISPSSQVRLATPPNGNQSSRMTCKSPSSQVRLASPPNVKHLASMKCISPSRQVRPASPPNVRQSSRRNCISPSSQARPVFPPNVKESSSMKCLSSSSQVRPAHPRNVKQSSSMNCTSPSTSDTQVFTLKPRAVSSQNPAKVDDINTRHKIRAGATNPRVLPYSTIRASKGKMRHQAEDGHRKNKVLSAGKGRINSQIHDNPGEKSAFDASAVKDADTGCESGIECLRQNIGMPVVISSSVEYARRPPPEAICWTGCFLVSDGASCNLHKFEAYFPSKVSSKVCDIAKKMPNNIKLEILPRTNAWPKSFKTNHPVYEDIGLLFFSNELVCEYKRPHLLKSCSFAMKAYIDDMKLLIYSSEVLPHDAQWINGENYLWGVFVKSKGKYNPARSSSIAT